jgi:hypothetical protein
MLLGWFRFGNFSPAYPAPLLQKSLSDNNLALSHTRPAKMPQPEIVFLFP